MQINIHTHKRDSFDFELFNAYTEQVDFPCTYGIHPWMVANLDEVALVRLEKLIQEENCFAIGECGLDNVCESDWDSQLVWFEKQIQLSEKYQKPLIIHCVKAIQELIVLKRKYQPKQPWIFHGFRKINTAEQLLKEGFYLSLGAALLKSIPLQGLAVDLPLDKLFLETDDKEISIALVYDQLSKLKQMDVALVEEKIASNFQRAFRRKLSKIDSK